MKRDQYLNCPMCGMEFEQSDSACSHGCPLGARCGLVRCPSCSYEFPRSPSSVSWLRRLLGTSGRRAEELCSWSIGLDMLRAGERARVIELDCESSGRRNTLTVFGLVPGAEMTLLQRRPSFVVRVGQTELGLDAEIAHEIRVERL